MKMKQEMGKIWKWRLNLYGLIELKKANESRHGDNRNSRTDNNNVVPLIGRLEVFYGKGMGGTTRIGKGRPAFCCFLRSIPALVFRGFGFALPSYRLFIIKLDMPNNCGSRDDVSIDLIRRGFDGRLSAPLIMMKLNYADEAFWE
jgi:hypothetical protein